MFEWFRERLARRGRVWSEIAAELGGVHHTKSRWWREDERIEVQRHVAVVLDMFVVSSGQASHPYTRATASYLHGPGPKLKLYKHGVLSAIGKAIGMQDVPLGDPVFDKQFVVKADNAAVARRLWSTRAMDTMRAHLADTKITSTPEQVELVGSGRWDSAARIRKAIELVSELAARDLYGVTALAQISATVEQPRGERPRAVLDTGTRVVVMAEDRDVHLVMAARTDARFELAPLRLEVDGMLASLRHQLPQAAHVHLARVGRGTLVIDGTLAFVWPHLELDRDRLLAGAELLGAIAAGARGVYR